MIEPFPQASLCFSWKSFCTDELRGWTVEYSPCMGEIEAFSIMMPDGREHTISDLDTVRGLHAMLGEAIKKAEEIERTEALTPNERKKTNGEPERI